MKADIEMLRQANSDLQNACGRVMIAATEPGFTTDPVCRALLLDAVETALALATVCKGLLRAKP